MKKSQFLVFPVTSVTSERCVYVFSFTGTLSDLFKSLRPDNGTLSDLINSLIESTLEVITWVKWGSPSIPFGRGDLHMTHVSIDVHNC